MTHYCAILSLAALFLSIAGTPLPALAGDATLTIENTHTSELKPFLLAKATFLPDNEESNPDVGYNDYATETCSDYTYSFCPDNAECTSCPIDQTKFKIESCKPGYYVQNDKCLPSDCGVLGYLAAIPDDQICTSVTEDGLSCYKDCRAISCSGYTLDCDTKPAHVEELIKCPDCQSKNAKCGNKVCKISKCQNGYKIANNGTECILLQDTCPANYYKECKNGIDKTFAPEFTEAGNKCYKCKSENTACPTGQINLDTYWCNGALKCFLPAK